MKTRQSSERTGFPCTATISSFYDKLDALLQFNCEICGTAEIGCTLSRISAVRELRSFLIETLVFPEGCGAVTFLVGSGSGSGAAFRLRLRFRVKLFGGSGSGSGQNVPGPVAPAPAPAPMIESSHESKPAIRFSKMLNVKI